MASLAQRFERAQSIGRPDIGRSNTARSDIDMEEGFDRDSHNQASDCFDHNVMSDYNNLLAGMF